MTHENEAFYEAIYKEFSSWSDADPEFPHDDPATIPETSPT